MMLSSSVLFRFQFCSSPTLNSTWPLGPDHESSIDMEYKYNVNDNFFSILCEKKVNDNFCPSLNSIWPLGPGHTSSMDITCKNNVNDNFSSTLSSRSRVNVKTILIIILLLL